MDGWGKRDYPTYGKVEEVIIWNDVKYFVIALLETVEFSCHFMGYKVVSADQKTVVRPQALPWHGVLNIILKNGDSFVVEKECASIEETDLTV